MSKGENSTKGEASSSGRLAIFARRLGGLAGHSLTFEDVTLGLGPQEEWIGDDDPWMLKSTQASLRWELKQEVRDQTVVGRAILAAHANFDVSMAHEISTAMIPGSSEHA